MGGVSSEADLISVLQSSNDFTGIHRLFSAHLQPFTPHLKISKSTTSRKPSKSSKSKPADDSPSIRSLAKLFLPFLHKSLSLIPKRLSASPKIPHDFALELFDVYRLCLDCLDVIVPELAGKPYAVQVQRVRYIHCLEHWELYKEAETEGFSVLESFHGIVGGRPKCKSRSLKARLVPELNQERVEQEFVVLVLEIVVTLVKCVSKRKTKAGADYRRVISLVNESESWFKVLDAKEHEKFHHFLVTNLYIIALFLVMEIKAMDAGLVREFCLITFQEYKKSSSRDQMCKVALKICSSLFSQRDEIPCYIISDMVKDILDFIAAECKVGMESTAFGFLELVSYCANKCRGAVSSLCDALAEHLDRLAGFFHEGFPLIGSILKMYVPGILLSSSNNLSKGENEEHCRRVPLGSALKLLYDKRQHLQQVADSLASFKENCYISTQEKEFHQRGPYSSSYWEALKFFCQSVADFIYSNRKDILSDSDSAFSWDGLGSIQDAFYQFCYIFLRCLSEATRERETSGDGHRLISVVVVAALMLSFRANRNVQESGQLVEDLISIEWVPAKRLKYLYISLNNIAAILNREKRLKETTDALRLSSKALWHYVVCLCETPEDKLHECPDDLSEKAITGFVKEASEKTAFLLELNQEVGVKINGFIGECLKNWTIAKKLIVTLPTPTSLVNKWVKTEYLLSKDAATEDGRMIYSLLPSTTEMPKTMLGKLLEEELLAYEEKSYINPGFCREMQMKIITILLEKVYDTDNCNLEKSRILIEKGKVLRAHGLEPVDECIRCLSDAILILKSIYSTRGSCSSQVHHLLIHAYLFRALCTQEAVPNSELLLHRSEFLQNTHAAVELCLSPDHGHADDHYEKFEDMLYIWYQLIDLLLIKGYLDILPPIYEVMIKFFNQKNVPLEKTLSELWKNRRLCHALCVSPVNDMLLRKFSEHWGQLHDSAAFWKVCMNELKPLLVGFHHLNNDIKQAASNLISDVPLSSSSIFFSSHLYYELSARLISNGQTIEALSCAKEAHHLRSKLLQQNFDYSVEKITEKFDEDGKIIDKSCFGILSFKINKVAATKVSCNSQGCVLTPWNVLGCYLESLLQVGVVQEILGNGSEAEMLLQWGKTVSQFQALPIFEVSFSSTLGHLYRKQRLWCLAEKELSSAKKVLADNRGTISCGKCVLLFETSIDQQLGDLFLSSSSCTGEICSRKMFDARSLYKSALENLNLCIGTEFEGGIVGLAMPHETSFSRCYVNVLEAIDSHSNHKSEKIEVKRGRRTKREMKATTTTHRQDSQGGHNRRITRSTYCSLGDTYDSVQGGGQIAFHGGLSTNHVSPSDAGCDHSLHKSEAIFSFSDFQSCIASLCTKMNCWHCLHLAAVDSISLNSFLNMSWELVYRKLSLRLILSIGKLASVCGNFHDVHGFLLQGISVLVCRNSAHSKSSVPALIFWIESIQKHFPGEVLAVERAALLYYICWFALQSFGCMDTRKSCELFCLGSERIDSLLKMAFILSREVPLLLQKISRLLAVLYVLSTKIETLALSTSEEGSESQWGSFFHQASLGTHLNQQLLSGLVNKQSQIASDSEDSMLPSSISASIDTSGSLRVAPESCEDLEQFVLTFFQGLPATPIICISLVAGVDAGLLRELLHCSPKVRAWILLSHLSSDNQHVVLLPVQTTLEEASGNDVDLSLVFNCKDFVKQWQCPWHSSVLDDIAPAFRHILEGNYYSSSEYFLEYIKENTSLWWMHRSRLDECLSKFLLDMEDLWLGSWKYLLLGAWPDNSNLDVVQKKLFGDEEHLLELVLDKKCYVALPSEESCELSGFENMMHLVFQRMLEKSRNSEQVECMTREPIILVLDYEVQMLPWENLPVLRHQEVYRMPSVGSVLATLDRCCQNHENFERRVTAFPLIDPLDSYYLLNPDGDLSRTQAEFESWFQDQHIEGKTGMAPTIEELTLALKNHDLFIYFGHGSGTQYIPGHEIQKLEKCAGTLLLGCSSGCLYLKGCYIPQGAPISYLQAGSPVIVANLWEVTDKDIDRFGKAMLKAWLRERSAASAECTQCDANLNNTKYTNCNHRPRIGSFMGQARDACNLGYLIGAAPVCYGVPTCITRKDV